MKFGIVSDLHLEHRSPEGRNELLRKINASDAVVVLNAGDLHPNKEERARFYGETLRPTYFVMGNHDYYRSSLTRDMGSTEINGIKLAWATLWTNFRMDTESMDEAGKNADAAYRFITDFRLISKLRPEDMIAEHDAARYFLANSGADVIMTHFPPFKEATHPRFAQARDKSTRRLNRYFVNDMADWYKTLKKKPQLWVAGHTHDQFDFVHEETRVVVHPLGYPHEHTVDEYELKVVDIETRDEE